MKHHVPILATLVCCGCASTARIHETNPEDGSHTPRPGIPFYAKTSLYKQTTSYAARWLDVSLQRTDIVHYEDKGVPKVQKVTHDPLTKRVPVAATSEIAAVRKAILDLERQVGGRAEIVEAFGKLPVADAPVRDADPIANSVGKEVFVDYERVFYLNTAMPWFGTATVNAEFASDGTLSTTSVTQTPQIAEAVSALLPLKEFLTAKYVSPLESTALQALGADPTRDTKALTVTYDLEIVENGYIYDFVAYTRSDPRAEETFEALEFDRQNGQFSRRPLAGAPPKPKKKNTKSIAVSGTVELPK